MLILTNILLLFVRKSGDGIKELIYAYLNSFRQNNSLRYGNNSYPWFTRSVIIAKKFKRTRLTSVHICYDCVCTRFGIF